MLTQKDIMVLGDYPSEADIMQGGSKFKDPASRFMFALIGSADISWSNMSFLHFWRDQSNFDESPLGDNGNHETFNKHLDIVQPKVIVTLGANISGLLVNAFNIKSYRGSVMSFERNNNTYWVIPTYDQRTLKSKMWKRVGQGDATRAVLFQNDIRKSVVVAENGWGMHEERFNLDPTIDEIEFFVDMVCKDKRLLYGDIEATGLNTRIVKTVVLGLAWTESDAIVIPLLGFGGRHNFSNPIDQQRCLTAIQKLFDNCGGIVWQNGANYDIKVLENEVWKFNYPPSAFGGDTLLLHHTCNPELPHDIGFMNSIYGKMPYWKESFLTKKENIFYTNQTEMRRYNARDCIAMVPIYKALLEECKVKGLTNLYRDAKKLSVIVHRMSNTGLKVSQKNLKKLQTWIDIEVNEKESTFRSLGKIPNKLNLASDPDMRTVWLGEKSSKVERLLNKQWQFQPWDQYRGTCSCGTSKWFTQQESKDIKDNPVLLHSFKSKCRKCKTPEWHSVGEIREGKAKSKSTKAYQEILNANQINAYIPPYILTTYKPRTTKEGASQVDKKFREAYITALVKRQEEITQLKAYQEENNSRYEYYRTQYKDIEKLIKMLSAYGEYAGMKKLQETYYHWDVGKDGRLHSDFKVFGTKTGRFSSKKPNLFTFPKSEKAPLLRQIFVPEDGKIFFSADYKGLENFVMAFVTKDRKLLEICADGRDLHDENTMALFDITPDDSRWNLFRSASKTYQFGTAYGGSDNEIYTQIISKFPETKLTLAKFKQAKGNLMKKHPGYANWVDQIVEKANTDRFVETYVNGRKRYLYGNKSDIRKEAMNTPIQGTAADIVNNAMIRIDERLRAEGLTAELVLYVYDELNYELPIEELPMVYKIVMEEMTKPVEILGITRHFKVDPEIGYTLGSLGSFDPETFEVTGSSKHA